MMADSNYSGMAKPLERARRDAADEARRIVRLRRKVKKAERKLLLAELGGIKPPRASTGFLDASEKDGISALRRKWLAGEKAIFAVAQPNLAASESIQHQAGSPTYHGYQVAIPVGWKALLPVFYPIPDAPDEPARQGMPAALLKGSRRFRVGVLLCRLETDGQEARQEFEGDALLEAAFLGQDGQYLQESPVRPIYGVVPLAAPSPKCPSQLPSAECLILLPLIDPCPSGLRESLPPIMMFVNGVRVYCSDDVGSAT